MDRERLWGGAYFERCRKSLAVPNDFFERGLAQSREGAKRDSGNSGWNPAEVERWIDAARASRYKKPINPHGCVRRVQQKEGSW